MAAVHSASLLIHLAPSHTGMFRFLLEAYENEALFTVLDKRRALLKLIFAEENRENVMNILGEINRTIPITWENWPVFGRGVDTDIEV